jgi:hypothetical protein
VLNVVAVEAARIPSHADTSAASSFVTTAGSANGLKWRSDTDRNCSANADVSMETTRKMIAAVSLHAAHATSAAIRSPEGRARGLSFWHHRP